MHHAESSVKWGGGVLTKVSISVYLKIKFTPLLKVKLVNFEASLFLSWLTTKTSAFSQQQYE